MFSYKVFECNPNVALRNSSVSNPMLLLTNQYAITPFVPFDSVIAELGLRVIWVRSTTGQGWGLWAWLEALPWHKSSCWPIPVPGGHPGRRPLPPFFSPEGPSPWPPITHQKKEITFKTYFLVIPETTYSLDQVMAQFSCGRTEVPSIQWARWQISRNWPNLRTVSQRPQPAQGSARCPGRELSPKQPPSYHQLLQS